MSAVTPAPVVDLPRAGPAGPPVRGLTKRWIMRRAAWTPGHSPSLLQRILAARGVSDAAEVKSFCEPRLADLHDSGLLPNISAAADRMIRAIRGDEVICIYGDYDVDGITATAILYHTLKTIHPAIRVRTYVPHRLEEGYGLNCEAMRQLKRDGAHLVITVDCGITGIEAAQAAREIGLDLIITDHHEPLDARLSAVGRQPESLPDALAIVHPRLSGSAYPFGELCGAGVAYKLAWHLAKNWCNSERVSEALRQTLVNLLPLAALGSIADVVPLLGENRILTAFGLRLMHQTPLPGLRALLEANELLGGRVDSEKVGFILAPRLNACGRMGHAAEAVRLLTEAGADEARAIVQQLAAHNQQRQGIERRIFDQACAMAEDAGMTADDRRAIVLAHESWHPGVVGIVCSRLVERFGRPAVLLNRCEGACKGSARSIDGYSIHAGLSACANLLTSFGGHAMAAGLALEAERLPALAEALIAHANAHIEVDHLTPGLTIDTEAEAAELTLETVRQLQTLGPFGRANRSPAVLLSGLTMSEPPRQVGAHGKHLQLRLRAGGSTEWRVLKAIWWNAGARAADLVAGLRLDAVIEPKIDTWQGTSAVAAEVRDVRIVR